MMRGTGRIAWPEILRSNRHSGFIGAGEECIHAFDLLCEIMPIRLGGENATSPRLVGLGIRLYEDKLACMALNLQVDKAGLGGPIRLRHEEDAGEVHGDGHEVDFADFVA